MHLKIIGSNKLAVNLLNRPPKFVKPILPFNVDLVTGLDGELEDDSLVTFNSPKAVDPENNKISIQFKSIGLFFMRMKQNPDNSFYIKVSKSLLPKKTATYKFSVLLKDDRGASAFPTMASVNVKYINKKTAGKEIAGVRGRGRGPALLPAGAKPS